MGNIVKMETDGNADLRAPSPSPPQEFRSTGPESYDTQNVRFNLSQDFFLKQLKNASSQNFAVLSKSNSVLIRSVMMYS